MHSFLESLKRNTARTLSAGAAIAFTLPLAGTAHAAPILTTLHSFCQATGCRDGSHPSGALLQDSAGDLYGTNEDGGKNSAGVIFKLVPNSDKSKYTEHILFNLCPRTVNGVCTGGAIPTGDLVIDVDGNLYGTTFIGGRSNEGVIFRLSPNGTGWTYKILHSFNCNFDNGCSDDGDAPAAGLSYAGQAAGTPWDESSPLFGTTWHGGQYNNGVVYQLTVNGSLWNFSLIHQFQSSNTPNEVLVDPAGNLIGTTASGGKYNGGLMFKLASGTWKETILHNFCNTAHCADGGDPTGRLFRDANGNLFGSTLNGGTDHQGYHDSGVVFERTAGGTYSVLYNFCANCADGRYPNGGLVMDGSGNLFGTLGTASSDTGRIFELQNSGGSWSEAVLYTFCSETNCADGRVAGSPLIMDASGNLFGVTEYGGANGDYGTVYRLTH